MSVKPFKHVIKLDTIEMELQSGTLYEMRTNYPIVDAVGLLQDNKGVFVQVSLHQSLKINSTLKAAS